VVAGGNRSLWGLFFGCELESVEMGLGAYLITYAQTQVLASVARQRYKAPKKKVC
jgi:hypothetical protein